MADNSEASTAATIAVEKTGPGNLTQGQAAARLFAAKAEEAKPTPPSPATETITPAEAETTSDAPVAEAESASVAPESESTANAAEPESETSALAEPEDKADPDVHSQSAFSLTPEQQKKFDARIAKETAKRKTLESKLADMETRHAAELAALKATPVTPAAAAAPTTTAAPATAQQPLPTIQDFGSLGQLQTQAKSAVRWAEEVLDSPRAWKTRTETDPDTGEETSTRIITAGDKVYTEAEVKGIMRNARVTLEDKIPVQAQFIDARLKSEKIARAEFPFLTDKSTPEYQQAQQMLRDPWVQERPDAEWIVGCQIVGMKALETAKAATAASTTKAKPKTPPVKPSSDQTAVSSSAAPAARVPNNTAARQSLTALEAKLREKGGITTAEAAASLLNRERFRNSR